MSRWLSMVGLAVVLAAAAVLSFAALRDLAIAVRISTQLAFLLPVAVDAGAAVSCAVWLSPTGRRDARRFACWLTWALLVLTVAANAAATGWHALDVTPPWWAAVVVGAIPPAVVGGVVHLLVLVGRADVTKPAPVIEDDPVEELPTLEDNGLSLWWRDAPNATPPTAPEPVRKPSRPAAAPPDVDLDRARELIADGAGRVRLQHEFPGLSEHKAKQLVKTLSNGHAS